MATEYIAGDGSRHDSEDGARRANTEAANMARTGNPYGITMEDLGGGLKAIVIIPYYLASICCSLFLMLFKLKTAGKVIQSIIMGILAYAVIFIVLSLVTPAFPDRTPEFIFSLLYGGGSLFFFGPAAWYFLKHYNIVKTIYNSDDGVNSFHSLVLISFCIGFYGLIIAGLVSLGSKIAAALIALVVVAAAVIVYIKRVKPFVEYAEANPND